MELIQSKVARMFLSQSSVPPTVEYLLVELTTLVASKRIIAMPGIVQNIESRIKKLEARPAQAPLIQEERIFYRSLEKILGGAGLSCRYAQEEASKRRVAQPTRLMFSFTERASFGKEAWCQYVGDPADGGELTQQEHLLLDAPSPFWPQVSNRASCSVVYVPATVNGKPLTLNLLMELMENLKGFPPIRCKFSKEKERALYGDIAIKNSYWIAVTKEPIPNTSLEVYGGQQNWVERQGKEFNFQTPKAIEMLLAFLVYHIQNEGGYVFEDAYGACEENLGISHLNVGNFGSKGISLSFSYVPDEKSCMAGVIRL